LPKKRIDITHMYQVNRTLQKINKKFHQILSAQILTQLRRGLGQKKRVLVLGLLGVIVLKLTLGKSSIVTLQGEAMCTPYHIQYLDRWGRNYQEEIDALLLHLHESLSTCLPDSEVSRFNEHGCSEFYFESPFFYPVFARSKEVYRNTAGAFDPTILPLIHAWEGSPTDTTYPDSLPVNSLREHISLDHIVANSQRIKKLKEGVKLDFRGILKGYAVDKIADLLHSHGIEHMRIVLGSKAVAYGKPGKINTWHMAIHPHLASLVGAELQIIMKLVGQAVAISSKKRQPPLNQPCIIDPATGHPAQHTLLAAAVVSKDCSTADAYATAMMVRGLAFAQELLAQEEGLSAFLIYEDAHGMPALYTSSSLHMRQKEHTITLQHSQNPS
jgi:thiamine biosynthesis lipoprotein